MTKDRDKKKLGKMGEDVSEIFLKRRGFHVIERSYRQRSGEIDIIAKKENMIVIVEVKTRASEEQGLAIEAVHYKKQKKIIQLAYLYVQEKECDDYEIRFDVIVIVRYNHRDVFLINHIEGAFTA